MKTVSIKKNKRARGSRIWIPIVLVLLIAGGGLGYYYWQQKNNQALAADTSTTTNYATARMSSINLTVAGSGTLAAGQESDLSFATSGTVDKVNVAVGDLVKKGDVLATQANLSTLQDNINNAQQNVAAAQETLDNLKQNAASNLANAQLAVVNAQKAVTDAKSSVVEKGWVRCDNQTLEAYYYIYTHAKDYLTSLGDGNGDQAYYNSTILPQKNIVAQAQANYAYCAGYTDYEISASQATVAVKEADLIKAQATLDTLTKNNGIDPIDLATAQNKVSSAELALQTAKDNLAGATLTAPFDGTILSVAGKPGDDVNTGAFITIADMANPLIDFSIDEADMDKIAVGQTTKIVFDALPDDTFQGKVTRINPELTTSGSYNVVTGVISMELDNSMESANKKLIKGLTSTVTIIQAQADNVLLVPISAIRDLGDGTYSVFVVGSNGQLTMKIVAVGLKDDTNAQIKSGLNAGDQVTTGNTQTK